MSECLCILINYKVLFGSSTQDRHARRIYRRTKTLVKPVMRQKTCNYIELFGSSIRYRHARRVICRRTFRE